MYYKYILIQNKNSTQWQKKTPHCLQNLAYQLRGLASVTRYSHYNTPAKQAARDELLPWRATLQRMFCNSLLKTRSCDIGWKHEPEKVKVLQSTGLIYCPEVTPENNHTASFVKCK